MTNNKSEVKNLFDLHTLFSDEKECRDYYTKIRFRKGMKCPYCKNEENIYRYQDGRLFKCSLCKKQFTVTVGTIFHKTHLPLRKWFYAIYVISSHKKGISSIQLGKDLGINQPTAWFLLHRIRKAMGNKGTFKRTLTRLVEADETYIGGRHRGKRGRGSENKKPVFGIVERGGNIFIKPVERTRRKDLQPLIEKKVDKEAIIMTDEWTAYNRLRSDYQHYVVNHKRYEWVRGDAHTNTIEGFWSLLKRGLKGIPHWVSHKHLFRYCTEYQFRYNTRKFPEISRFKLLLSLSIGMTISWSKLVN